MSRRVFITCVVLIVFTVVGLRYLRQESWKIDRAALENGRRIAAEILENNKVMRIGVYIKNPPEAKGREYIGIGGVTESPTNPFLGIIVHTETIRPEAEPTLKNYGLGQIGPIGGTVGGTDCNDKKGE